MEPLTFSRRTSSSSSSSSLWLSDILQEALDISNGIFMSDNSMEMMDDENDDDDSCDN
jgi:hypothetical protein